MTDGQTPDSQDSSATGGTAPGPPSLAVAELRWRCRAEDLPFETTADIEPIPGVIGQDSAVEALRFGLESRASGQNVFVRGLTGTGRMTLLQRLLVELGPSCPEARDRCYVHNFTQVDRPRLISLAKGRARRFRRAVDDLANFIRDELKQALSSEGVQARKTAVDQTAQQQVRALVEPFERSLKEAGLALVSFQVGPVTQSTVFPLVDDKPVAPEKFEQLHHEGQVSEKQLKHYLEVRDGFQAQLVEMNRRTAEIRHRHMESLRELFESEARAVLSDVVTRIQREFTEPAIETFLQEVVDDVVGNRLPQLGEDDDFTRLYRVNVLHEHEDDTCPIIIENAPTLTNLLGAVEREAGPLGVSRSDHLMIRCGSLLQADGGYLVMEARDVLAEPGAWKVLVRTLRSGRLEIIPPELSLPWLGQTLKPEPIDLNVKVILIGGGQIYHLLDSMDPDFPNLFKVLADFDTVIPRDERGVVRYAGVLSRLCVEEQLAPFDRTAVAALVEHGARVAARRGKLTARFGRVADLAREAAFLAGKQDDDHVDGRHVAEAVARTKRRGDLPARRFRELIADGTVRIETSGRAVGQINGLAVLSAGQLTYGFPARITATIGPGTAGVINIEREAALSGAIHTKGFYILGGLLRRLLQTDHPLAFDASVAFEQSYGGIDGDSASGAEICCLLSALTGQSLRQDMAMTGAIDQVGNILAIGAVNEKIEGFFDVCRDIGFTGTQGVIIPGSNAGDLMLRDDVVEKCREDSFHVYAVDTVHEALELLTGLRAGLRDDAGGYPEGTLLELAVRNAHEYWRQAAPGRRAAPATSQTED